MSSFYEACDATFEVKEFHGEHGGSSLRAEESAAIRNFLEDRNPYHVLAKSENGKPNLKEVFAGLVNQLLGIDTEVFLLVDLDGGELDALLADIAEQIRDRHAGPGLELGEHSIVDRTSEMVAGACEVLTATEKVKGEFHVVAFHRRPEPVIGASKDVDASKRREQMERLLEEDDVFGLLDGVLNDGS